MKKLLLSLTALILIITACDKIDTSKEVFHIIWPVVVTYGDPDFNNKVVQKIYVESFTGHLCVSCPAGARALKAIMDTDTTIINTAIHCTMLADPRSQPPFNVNFKTPMGDIICSDFNISGIPKAMINRKKVPGSNDWGIGRAGWKSAIDAIDRNNIRAGIELRCSRNESTQEIDINVGVTIIKAIPNPVQLCIVLQQDGIVSGQIDDGVPILDYTHNHMLRAGFNGNYGTRLTPTGIVEEKLKYVTNFKLHYGNSFLYSNIPVEIENCSVVAYLLDMVTKEVIQVECVHLD
jgi:hypothetical protein